MSSHDPSPPTAEEYRRLHRRPVLSWVELLQIRWRLFGPLSDCVEIAQDARDPSSISRPFSTTDPIASLPATEPPVSSVMVKVDDLEEGPGLFLDLHYGHADASEEWTRAPLPTDEDIKQAMLRLFKWGDDDRGNVLTRCCGVRRPCDGPKLTVTATNHPFVTVADYVTTLHPWLQSLKDDILYSRGILDDQPLSPDLQLYVRLLRPVNLSLMAEQKGRQRVSELAAKHLRMRDGEKPRLDHLH
ncbi:hypothetical protein ANO11243_092010 [Dothideomycetidae sp. 11243]|nr:hypothetical protein ANO11243_092010 [fungal sp. No.11243]